MPDTPTPSAALAEAKQELAAERSFSTRLWHFAKTFGTAAGVGLAGLAGVSAHVFPAEEKVAKETASASAAGLTALDQEVVKELAATKASCETVSAAAVRDAKAETDSVRTLVLGYMLALQSRGGANTNQAELQKALGEVVAGLGKQKAATLAPILDSQAPVSAAVMEPAAQAAPEPAAHAPTRKATYRLQQLAK
jgi:hypothetical protein